jgi:hypothetical protein
MNQSGDGGDCLGQQRNTMLRAGIQPRTSAKKENEQADLATHTEIK